MPLPKTLIEKQVAIGLLMEAMIFVFWGILGFPHLINAATFTSQVAGTSTDSGTLRDITGNLGAQGQYQAAYLWQPTVYSIWCTVSWKVTRNGTTANNLHVDYAENGTSPSDATIFASENVTTSTLNGAYHTYSFQYCRNAPAGSKNWIIFTEDPEVGAYYQLHVGNQNASATALGWYSLGQVADIWTTSTNELLGSIKGTDNATDTHFYASSTDSFNFFGTPASNTTINVCSGYDLASVQGALCNIFSYLFVPSTSVLQSFADAQSMLATKIPWGWWSQVSSQFASVSTTDAVTSSTAVVSIPHNGVTSTFAILDISAIQARIPSNVLDQIRTLGGVAMWALFGTWIWHLVTGNSTEDSGEA